jgi:hypothetical protein
MLHSMSGIRTIEYFGAFGHRYYINSLSDIIRQVIRSSLLNIHNIYYVDVGNGQSTRSSSPPFLP